MITTQNIVDLQESDTSFLDESVVEFEDKEVTSILPNYQFYESDVNDDVCFKCKSVGELVCCDICPRSYHPECRITLTHNKHNWICEYCLHQDRCFSCLKDIIYDTDHILRCSHCYLPTHESCHKLPYKEMQYYNYYLLGKDNFICEDCMKNNGIKEIFDTNRVRIESQERIVYLVNLNVPSPIHCGWYEEHSLDDSIQKSEYLHSITSHQAFPYSTNIPQIQTIIKMNVPLRHRHQNIDSIIQILLDDQRSINLEYGRNNFFFLVKWVGKSYTKLTWEDEMVVRKNQNFLLKRFLMYKRFQIIGVRQKKISVREYFKLFEKFIWKMPELSEVESNAIRCMKYFRTQFPGLASELMMVNSTHQNDYFKFLCAYISSIYIEDASPHSTIILSQNNQINAWSEQLRNYCSGLNVLMMEGSDQEIEVMKQKLFVYEKTNQSKFHVLLLTYERFMCEKQFIFDTLSNFNGTILFSNLSNSKIIDHFDTLNNKQILKQAIFKMYVLFDNQANKEDIYKSIRHRMNKDKEEFFIKHNVECDEQAKCSIPKISMKDRFKQISKHQIINSGSWTEAKRAAFLRYILLFGFNADSPVNFYLKLMKFDPELFLPRNHDLNDCKKYICQFMAFLHQHKEMKSDNKQFFLFSFQISEVLVRICKLESLNSLLRRIKQNLCELPMMRNIKIKNESGEEKIIKSWTSDEDYALAFLIKEHGYGQWQKIFADNNWNQKSHNQATTFESQPLSFGLFIKLKFLIECKNPIVQPLDVIISRGEELINAIYQLKC